MELNAGAVREADHRIYLVDDNGSRTVLDTTGFDVGDRILITESYYFDANGVKQYLSNTAPTAPNGVSIYTQVSYIDTSPAVSSSGIPGLFCYYISLLPY